MQIYLCFILLVSNLQGNADQAQAIAWTNDDNFTAALDCFTLLLAWHLADVLCYIGPSMPSGICMEIHTEIVQKRKKKPSHNKGTPRQPHVYL